MLEQEWGMHDSLPFSLKLEKKYVHTHILPQPGCCFPEKSFQPVDSILGCQLQHTLFVCDMAILIETFILAFVFLSLL